VKSKMATVQKKKAAVPAKKAEAKKAAPAASGAGKGKDFHTTHKHLFNKEAKDFRVGRDIQPKRDLSRFVKWPRYVRLQRQRVILNKRIKIPPSVNQFTKTLEKNQASTLFRLLAHYRPETVKEKKERLLKQANAEVKGQEQDPANKPRVIKFGLNHVTHLVENRKAKLVVIAHDVDPVELVIWLPALCRKYDIPYVIIKGKARLGHLVHQKTATCLALVDVKKEHQSQLDNVISIARPMFNDAVNDRKKWGGRVMGFKSQAIIRIREREAAREAAKIK